MVEQARVFMIEDQELYQDRIRRILEDAGHSVVLVAAGFDEAAMIIKGDKITELGVQVTTIDGNLGFDSREGDLLADFMRSRFPHVKTVGISNGRVDGVDIFVSKGELNLLPNVLNRL